MSYGSGGHQGGRGNNNNYPPQQGGYSFPSSSNNVQYNYGMQQQYGGNAGYQEQYYPQENYYEYGREGYEDADYDNLDEIDRAMGHGQSQDYEAEMIREMESMQTPSYPQPRSGPYVPQAAMPTHNGKLSSHAHEFWFPEARNCPCCKGFKHGCNCCKNGVDTCKEPTCTSSANAPAGDSAAAGTEAASTAPASDANTAAGEASPASGLKVHPPAPAPATGGATEFCKYESTPGGCRFGASCRFPHSAPAVASPTGVRGAGAGGYNAFPPGPPNGAGAKCVYFARGGCQFGEKCRFSHVL